MKIGIIIGSVRDGRTGECVAQWVKERSASQQGTEFEVVDVLDFDLPFVTEERLPAMVNGVYANDKTTAFGNKVAEFDAFIFVTAEYNHGMPGPFKNAYDLLAVEWVKKAVAFVGYGAMAGARAVEQWRQVVANASMYDIRAQVGVSIFTDIVEGKVSSERLDADLDGLFAELLPAAAAMNGLRG